MKTIIENELEELKEELRFQLNFLEVIDWDTFITSCKKAKEIQDKLIKGKVS